MIGLLDDINRIILVTDGIETCDANPVAEARKLKQAGIKVTTDVIGFDVAKPDEAKRLRAIAEAPGGTYTHARTSNALNDYFNAERDRIDDLAKQYLCVTDQLAQISSCQSDAAAKGMQYMTEARVQAAESGDDPGADEIDRLRAQLSEARDERREELDRRRASEGDRIKSERAEARRRLEQLDR